VTNTPVPKGIGGYCNKTNGEGGCPPREATVGLYAFVAVETQLLNVFGILV
jgi:hypothetical protein